MCSRKPIRIRLDLGPPVVGPFREAAREASGRGAGPPRVGRLRMGVVPAKLMRRVKFDGIIDPLGATPGLAPALATTRFADPPAEFHDRRPAAHDSRSVRWSLVPGLGRSSR
jgi:hypothetical protein